MYFDTALINDPLVLEYLMRKIDSAKILYGSDSPLAFHRGKDICINNKHYYVSDKITPWGLGPMDEKFIDLTFYVFEEIRAMLYATRAVYGNFEEKHLEKIFYLNALGLIKKREIEYA